MYSRYGRVGLTVRVLLLLGAISPTVAAQTWTATGSPNVARNGPTAVLLADGRVLAAAGESNVNLSSAEIFDPATATWTLTPNMAVQHGGAPGLRLRNNRVLVCGGYEGPTNVCEIYDPVANTWAQTGGMNQSRANFQLVLLQSGKVLAMGGYSGGY